MKKIKFKVLLEKYKNEITMLEIYHKAFVFLDYDNSFEKISNKISLNKGSGRNNKEYYFSLGTCMLFLEPEDLEKENKTFSQDDKYTRLSFHFSKNIKMNFKIRGDIDG